MAEHEQCLTALKQSLQETLEEMAFVELTPLPAAPEFEEGLRQVVIATLDEWDGQLWLRMDGGLLQEIIENVYAVESSEIDAAMELDMLAEVLNTLAGKVLRRLTAGDRSFRLGLPTERLLENKVAHELNALFESEGRRVEAIWQLESIKGGR